MISACDPQTVKQIDAFMRTHNMLPKAYKMLSEIEIEQRVNAESSGLVIPSVSMTLHRDRNIERGRYNLPTVAEVAMIFHSEDGQPPFERDIRLNPRGDQKFINLNILSPNLDPMTLITPLAERCSAAT